MPSGSIAVPRESSLRRSTLAWRRNGDSREGAGVEAEVVVIAPREPTGAAVACRTVAWKRRPRYRPADGGGISRTTPGNRRRDEPRVRGRGWQRGARVRRPPGGSDATE